MDRSSSARKTVLLIEDSDSDAELCEMMLLDAAPGEFDVVRTATLAEAMAHLDTRTMDCAVVDLGLPDAEGIEVIEALAAHTPTLALVVLTGRDDDELGVAAIVSGANDYLSKATLGGKLLVRSLRYAILRKRFEDSFAEAQSIAHLGSWEVDLATEQVTWSRELYRVFDLSLDERPTHEALLERTHPDDRQASTEAILTAIEHSTPFELEHRIMLPGGEERWICARGRVEVDARGRPERLLGTAQDITEQKAAAAILLHQAFHDPLSGLPNRLLLLDRLSQALKRLGRQPTTVGVIYVDIDRFQVINDSLGHPVGDQLLVAMATRLKDFVRPADTLARVGGDEFVVLCEGLSGESEAIAVADRLRAAMTGPLAWGGGELVISVSAGIATTTSASVSPDSLLRDADAAMYRAKSEGRARSAVFAETMRATAIDRLDTEVALRQSIVDGDLRVHYQPIVSLETGQIVGHEALVRWQHPTKGLLSPAHFIPIAEETGLIVPLGAWVLREACLQARRFQTSDPRFAQLTMSVNLSAGQLGQPDLTDLITTALRDADLEPRHLQLEMTESMLMDDAPSTITILQTLNRLGVRLGVDDFGTGYSSLAYLKRFPVDVLKIDRSFVSGLGRDPEDSAIAAAVNGLADALGLTVTAEGVETAQQRDYLVALGCARAQGYYFGYPVDACAAEIVLSNAGGHLHPAEAVPVDAATQPLVGSQRAMAVPTRRRR